MSKQSQTRFVMGENEPDNRVDVKGRRTSDRFAKQDSADSAAPEFLIDINAHFGGAAISAAREKRFQRQPTGDFAIGF